MKKAIKRGEVYLVNFDPTIGGEIKKTRPAVVVSTDKANPHLNRVIVIPLTSNVEKLYPAEAKVILKKKESKAMADQIRTISKQRIIKKIGKLDSKDMKKIEDVIKLVLELF